MRRTLLHRVRNEGAVTALAARSSAILGCVPQTHTTKALANPAQPHKALINELERYIESHHPDRTDVNVLSATDTGQADKSHKPVRHWYHVTYEA
jgi:hypothetical protein